jgi:hypothetical protein
MEDHEKTKAQLIEELAALRRRLADAESRLAGLAADAQHVQTQRPMTRSERTDFHVDIDFAGDFEVVRGKGIDLSESGICFKVTENLPFQMQFEVGGEKYRSRAYLVWVKRLSEERCRLGFEFIPSESYRVV